VPGPRYLAASPEITVARGRWATTTLPHLPYEEFSFGKVSERGPEEMPQGGAHLSSSTVSTRFKLNLSGDNFVAHADAKDQLDERRGSRHGGARDQAARQSATRCMRARKSRSSQALRHGIEGALPT